MTSTNSGREPSLSGQQSNSSKADPRLAGDRAVLHMVEQLDSPDPIVRERAALALGEMGDERAFELILELTHHSSRVICGRASRALANFTSPHHFEPQLAVYWEEPYPDMARRVIACDRQKAFEAFMAALSSQDGRRRRIAAKALDQFDDRDLVPLYIGLLEDSDRDVRSQALHALHNRPDVRAVPALLTLLNSSDFREIQSAAMTLGRIGDPRAVDPLLPLALGGYARSQAAWALGMLNNPEAAAAVIAVALNKEEDPARRFAAAESLSDMRERSAVEPLLRIYDDPSEDSQLRHKILALIGEIGGEEAEDRLAQEITDADPDIRMNVFRGLREIYTERSARLILTLVDDPDPGIRRVLATHFEELQFQVFPQVTWPALLFIEALHSERPTLRKCAAQALGHIRMIEIETLLSERPELRKCATRDLGHIPHMRTDQAAAALHAALGDPDPEVRTAVIRTLTWYPKSTEADELILTLLMEGDQQTRIAAMHALPINPHVIEHMIKLVDDPDPVIRHHAINVLGRCGVTDAIPALIRHLDDLEAPPRHLIDTVGLPRPYMGGRVCDVAAAFLEAFYTPESLAALEAWRRTQPPE